jgi:hypothetical protein
MRMSRARRSAMLRVISAATTCVVAACASGAVKAQTRPVLFIEGFRTTDSLSREAASALRVGMARLSAERRWPLHVMTTAEIDAFRSVGSPDDFGGAWPWTDVREVANVYRAYAVVDVIAVRVPTGVRLEASRLHPVPRGRPTRLPDVYAASLADAIAQLTDRLAADTIITQGK